VPKARGWEVQSRSSKIGPRQVRPAVEASLWQPTKQHLRVKTKLTSFLSFKIAKYESLGVRQPSEAHSVVSSCVVMCRHSVVSSSTCWDVVIIPGPPCVLVLLVVMAQVDLAAAMDPERLMDAAVDLNLKLMLWRAAPSLDLNAISATRCLLLGSGGTPPLFPLPPPPGASAAHACWLHVTLHSAMMCCCNTQCEQ
jgi:hypothetical protein